MRVRSFTVHYCALIAPAKAKGEIRINALEEPSFIKATFQILNKLQIRSSKNAAFVHDST